MGELHVLVCFAWILFVKNGLVVSRYLEKNDDKLPCTDPESGTVFPFISDYDGRYLSTLDDYFNHLNDQHNIYPMELKVSFIWYNKTITLLLKQNLISGVESVTEWTEDNITYAEIIDEKCYYQGVIKDQMNSHVAVSLCNGLSGYMKKDSEELLIWPENEEDSSSTSPSAHNVLSCTNLNDEGPRLENMRFKRQAPSGQKKYLEVLIAADTSVTKLVGEEKVKKYIMTIMNIVNMVYKDESLGVNLDVITSKIVLMDKTAERSVVASGDARSTVDKFCQWVLVESYKNKYFGRGTRFDVAVFLTRTGIGPAGYAPITGLCNPSRSCAVVKDEGFTSALIVAHEIAHVFGLMHDGHGNNCQGPEYQTAIMAPMVQATLNHNWWSSCSRERMKQLIPILRCIDNNPLQKETIEVQEPFGSLWDIDEQCKYEFGPEHQACRTYHGDLCEMLWCNTKRNQRFCKTKRGRPLNGTGCGNERWCMNGACTYYGGQPPRDGGFGEWSKWSACAEDCGFSIKTRTRKCDNPRPAYGGKDCKGEYQQVDSCKAEPCKQYTDKREFQCTVLDVLPVRDRRNTWLPYQLNDESKRCKLTCISNETKEIATFDDIPVDDGTPCSYENPNHICVQGECWEIGCDGVRNSTKQFDECGICDGDGSNCKTVQGGFTKRMKYSGRDRNYHEVTMIPAGARNIEIRETATSAHFIALLDPAYGTFAIGGNKHQSHSKKFVANGAWFNYENSWNFETLTSDGPLKRKIKLMIFPQNSVYKAALGYKYTVRADDNTFEKELYDWKYQGWTECSVTCGSGTQSLIYKCFDKSSDKETDNENCRLLEDPTGDPVKCTRVQCNADLYRWVMSVEWSDCTATCGKEGIQYQLYSCEREAQDGEIEPVSMEMCSSLGTPEYSRECNRVECKELEYRWIMSSDWSDCSRTCGGGIETKAYSCGKDTSDGAIEVVDMDLCDHLMKPNITRICNPKMCEEYQWVMVDDWNSCSEKCGNNGIETQMFFCGKVGVEDDVETTGFEKCFDREVPNITRPCNRFPCVTYHWAKSDEWTECNASCGDSGQQYAVYKCMTDKMSNSSFVDPDLCNDRDRPFTSRECNRYPCFHYTLVDSLNWTECSSSCGDDGLQQKIFHCVNETFNGQTNFVDLHFCSNLDVYTSNVSRVCNRQPCDRFEWIPTDEWSSCTATCGDDAIQYQRHDCTVFMSNGGSEKVSEDYCNVTQKPDVQRDCNREPCLLEWSAGGWSECSVTCGIGLQWREVTCGDPDSHQDDSLCLGDPPSLSEVCKRKDCPASSDTCRDKISVCKRNASPRKCQYRGYKSMCCATCRNLHNIAPNDSWYRYRRFS